MVDGLYLSPADGHAVDQSSTDGAEGIKNFGPLFPFKAHSSKRRIRGSIFSNSANARHALIQELWFAKRFRTVLTTPAGL